MFTAIDLLQSASNSEWIYLEVFFFFKTETKDKDKIHCIREIPLKNKRDCVVETCLDRNRTESSSFQNLKKINQTKPQTSKKWILYLNRSVYSKLKFNIIINLNYILSIKLTEWPKRLLSKSLWILVYIIT